MNLDLCAGILAIVAVLVLLLVVWLCVSREDVNELIDENRRLRDVVAANEERESASKMRAASRGGRVPR